MTRRRLIGVVIVGIIRVVVATAGHADLERLRAAAAERRVDYLVVGSLTAFSTENKRKTFGGLVPTPLLVGNVTKQQTELHVELTFRIVDVRTGEIVATGSGDGVGNCRRRATRCSTRPCGRPSTRLRWRSRRRSCRLWNINSHGHDDSAPVEP